MSTSRYYALLRIVDFIHGGPTPAIIAAISEYASGFGMMRDSQSKSNLMIPYSYPVCTIKFRCVHKYFGFINDQLPLPQHDSSIVVVAAATAAAAVDG